jgi:hypothetical protein
MVKKPEQSLEVEKRSSVSRFQHEKFSMKKKRLG